MLLYQSNLQFETMDTTEEGRILFNPETGDVHMLDFVGNTIYTLLEKEQSFDALIDTLVSMFDAEPGVIAADVEVYLKDAVEKEIITAHEA